MAAGSGSRPPGRELSVVETSGREGFWRPSLRRPRVGAPSSVTLQGVSSHDLVSLLAARGTRISEIERRAGTGRESLRRLASGKRDPARVSTGVIVRLSRAAGVSVEKLLSALRETRALKAEQAERRRRTEEAMDAARWG
jgi:plasmid maintenance system antidote protein VapI